MACGGLDLATFLDALDDYMDLKNLVKAVICSLCTSKLLSISFVVIFGVRGGIWLLFWTVRRILLLSVGYPLIDGELHLC